MTSEGAEELRRRRRRYQWEARRNRYANAWAHLAYAVFSRLPPRLRTRVQPGVVVVAGSLLVGLLVGTVYWALNKLGVSPVVLGIAVVLLLWLWAAIGVLLLRHRRSDSGHGPPPASSGGGFSGVREPRRPPPSPRETAVEMTEPTGNEE